MGWGHNIMYDIVGFLFRLHSCCLKITSPWRHSSPRRVRSMQWCIVWHCSCGNGHGCLNKSMRRGSGLRQSQISWSSVILCICLYSHTYTCFLWCWDGNTCKKKNNMQATSWNIPELLRTAKWKCKNSNLKKYTFPTYAQKHINTTFDPHHMFPVLNCTRSCPKASLAAT